MYNDVVADDAMIVNSNVGMYEAVGTDLYMIADEYTGLQVRAFTYFGGVADHFSGRLEGTEVVHDLHISTKRIGSDQEGFSCGAFYCFIDDDDGSCRVEAGVIIFFKV